MPDDEKKRESAVFGQKLSMDDLDAVMGGFNLYPYDCGGPAACGQTYQRGTDSVWFGKERED